MRWCDILLTKAKQFPFSILIQVLIEAGGADINHPSTRLETALYLAALEGHTAIVKLLISHGADIDQPATQAEQTPLMVSILLLYYMIV